VTYCVVPQLKGLPLAKARTALTAAHCVLGKVTKADAAKAKRGKVLSQAVPAKLEVRTGTKVALSIGK
jgi:beta-lactam-binding protein with PASTA domain